MRLRQLAKLSVAPTAKNQAGDASSGGLIQGGFAVFTS